MDFVLHWLEARQPDVVGLQELKLEDDQFPHLDFEAAGYKAVTHGQKAWNGVAILDVFLAEMAAVVPWSVLESLIEPHYPKVGPQGGRRPFPIAVMLRIYCLQQWYQLSDPGAEEALYDIHSMREFCNLS
jgi:hypothetical protein